MEKRCIIVSGGRPGPAPQPQPGDLVIACDRGYRYCAVLGLQPDLFIGDFDSYDGAVDPAVPVERLSRRRTTPTPATPSAMRWIRGTGR